MVERALLHQLVDSLPESALERVHRILQYQQNAIDEHDDMDKLHRKMQKHIQRRLERMGGGVAGTGGGGSMWPDGSGHFSVQGFDEDGAHLTLTHRYYQGRALEISERISFSADRKTLAYRQEITGPDGQRSTHEAQFPMSSGI